MYMCADAVKAVQKIGDCEGKAPCSEFVVPS